MSAFTVGERRIPRVVTRTIIVGLLGLIIGSVGYWAVGAIRDRRETQRTTAEFDPPVWAGQNPPGGCPGGFYARREQTIVLTISAHCATPGAALRDAAGKMIGVFGQRAVVDECPPDRLCQASDFLAMALVAERIPWGHLNVVDLGAGGYRTIESGTAPFGCGDVKLGDLAETNGREHYRTGKVVANDPYDFSTDVIFPCMIRTGIQVHSGDSGGSVLVNGIPAGVMSRTFGETSGFTPLAEGLENLGLTLCTTPDCDLSPDTAVQPAG
ncbi:MAG TPA: hypothetical protein VM451_03975 [Candidatus Limnocylindria bacterium]|nr:hypothetical protein [Candidatus Limnocylindria bacterium]